MKRTGLVLLIVGAISLVLVLLPNSLYYSLNLGQNFVTFVNGYLIIIAIFFLSAGPAAMIAGKKRLSKSGDML